MYYLSGNEINLVQRASNWLALFSKSNYWLSIIVNYWLDHGQLLANFFKVSSKEHHWDCKFCSDEEGYSTKTLKQPPICFHTFRASTQTTRISSRKNQKVWVENRASWIELWCWRNRSKQFNSSYCRLFSNVSYCSFTQLWIRDLQGNEDLDEDEKVAPLLKNHLIIGDEDDVSFADPVLKKQRLSQYQDLSLLSILYHGSCFVEQALSK